jgi:NAD(P)-dependent dehydrogenase (short-subunit alcohol dehydrogenase family)
MSELKGQTAIVTGAGQGIGREIALALTAAGASVAVTGRTQATLAETVATLESLGGHAIAIVGDVSKPEDCEQMAAETLAKLGRIDILVNNAGISGVTRSTLDMTLEEWQEVIDIDLTGPWLATKAVLPAMTAAGAGVILNISSLAGRTGYPMRAPYAAAKWGLIGLTQTWAGEWGKAGIRCNCICPGAIAGDRIERVIQARATSLDVPYDTVKAGMVSQAALARMASEYEVAQTARFLCGPGASGITGQTVNVDCGTSMD